MCWWDPQALVLGVEPAIGIRREALIMKDVPDAVVAEGLREYERWRSSREQAIARGSVPSVAVQTATEWGSGTGALAEYGLPSPVQVHVLDARGPESPGGARFGRLVHAVLASMPLDATPQQLDRLVEIHGRILSAPAEEAAAALDTVQRVLTTDLLARGRRADAVGGCRRETPVTCRLADGTVVEGMVDLAFEENGSWIVVDYKTDREIAAAGEERYRRQVGVYASAIAQATGATASGILVRI